MRRKYGLVMVAALLLAVAALPMTAQAGSGPQAHVVRPLKVSVSPAVRDLPKATRQEVKPEGDREVNPHNAEVPERILNAADVSGVVDPAVQNFHAPNALPAPIMNFEGVPNVNGVYPPDTQGDVGVINYVQWVNLSFDIYDKTTGLSVIGGPVNGNSLWAGFGGSCESNNSGDPITLYDHLAGRWFMSQFTGDNHQCIAVSQTGDPTGAWYLYDYLADAGLGYFPDYPKFGVWPDGYYYSANMFGNGSAMVGVFERDQMLAGGPAQFIWFYTPDTNALPSYSQLPADLDGANLPPAGAPNPFVELVDDAWGYDPPYDTDGIVVTPLHVDWATPGNSTFGPPAMIDLTGAGFPFDSNLCGYNRNCIPQPGTAQGLDALSSRLMYRLQYRNFGSYETLMTSHSVDENGADHAGVRWYELRDSGGGWGIEQAGTYAPDSDHRWMADAAMDASGDIAVGFSVSSSTTYPTIRWAGRLAGDPAGTLAQGEDTVIAGSGSQTGSAARWGDYSAMSVDPTDDCTFWYTTEYIVTTGGAPWQTRIASFKFPSCTPGATGTIDGTVTNAATLAPVEGALIQIGGYSTYTDAAGFYSMLLPIDTYDVTASAFGYAPQTVTGIEVLDGMTTTQDFALVPVGEAFLDGWVTGAAHGWPLYAQIVISTGGDPVATVFTDPFNGYYEVELPQLTPYDIEVTSLIPGYNPAMRGIVLGPAGQTESFALASDGSTEWVQCVLGGGIVEDFDGPEFPPPGWVVTDDSGSGNVWMTNEQWGEANYVGEGLAAHIDSDNAGSGAGLITTTLYSPFVQLPSVPKGIRFNHYFNALGDDQVWFDISTDGGATWTTLYTTPGPDAQGTLDFDLSAYADMMVQFRWVYTDGGSWAWWWQIDDVATYELPPPPPPPYLAEDFEGSFPPAGWTVVDNISSGMVWNRNDLIPSSNRTGGDGYDAGADSDATCFDAPWDTTLYSAPVDLTGSANPQVTFKSNFQDYAGSGQAWFDMTNDGGATWTNVWYSSVDDPGGTGGGGVWRSFDLTSYVGDTVQFRWRYSDDFDTCAWFWHIDNFTVAEPGPGGAPPDDPPPLICSPVPGSLVEGFVLDANTGDGINGADVMNDIGGATETMATPDDPNLPDGFYWMFTPLPLGEGPSTRTFTASAPNYAEAMAEVNLIPDTVNQLSFSLDAGWLEMTPHEMAARLYAGMTEDQPMDILNWGTIDANVSVNITPIAPTWQHSSPVHNTADLPGSTDPTSMGRAPATAGEGPTAARNPNRPMAGPPAFGMDLYPDSDLVSWADLEVPGTWTSVAGGMGSFFAGDFLLGDFSMEYVLDYDTNTLLTVDTGTGAITAIGPAPTTGGESWSGLTAAGDGTMYASGTTCAGSTLYTIDPATGTPTVIGPITGGDCIIDIAINPAGELYGVDIVGDNLMQIDPATGAGTIIGPLGVDANYAQGMDFDDVSGILYWASYSASGELRIIDTMTGASSLVGAFPGGAEVCALAVATFAGGGGVPWLIMTPDEGVVPPEGGGVPGDMPVNAEFIADGAPHYGLFRANVWLAHDTPYDVNDMPVCFTKAFNDVPEGSFGDARIHALAGARISLGCGYGDFCPTDQMTRGVMALWLINAMFGPDYAPPPCTGIFEDVICEETPNARYIEALYNEGVTAGCSADPLLYCPDQPVLRSQMAVFLLKASLGSDYVPPACVGIFDDVPCPGGFAVNWIEDLYNRGITSGCGPTSYCPNQDTNRDQMSIFVGKAFDLPMCTP